MTKDDKHETDPKQDLLEMWMGESEEDAEAPRHSPLHQCAMVLLAVAAVILCVVLAKYAADVLVILLTMAVAVLVLRVVETFLVESSFFTFGTFAILAVGAALFAYLFLMPGGSSAALTRYVPAPVFTFLDWSESHGWGHTALIQEPSSAEPHSAPQPASAPAPELSSSRAAAAAPTAAPSLGLTASPSSSTLGAPVYLTARMSASADLPASAASVRFRDGLTVLGAADLRQEGQARVAVLTVRGLSEGRHELTAELVGTLGFASVTSEPVVHVVMPGGR
jgi:Bacterial Ig-like domain (group 3)